MQRSSSSSRLSSSNFRSHSYSTDTLPKVPPTEPQGGGARPTDEIPARPKIPALTFAEG